MMVVHEDSETPVDVAIIRKPLLEQKSYVIVKNHVRELIKTDESTCPVMTSKEKSPQPLENVRKKSKSNKKSKKTALIPVTSPEYGDETNDATEIDKNDLEELRTVYKNCKEVMKKIEAKYGHLLDLDGKGGSSSCKKRKFNTEECTCKPNTKIVFDDDGKQSMVKTVPEKHICTKKTNKCHSEMKTRSRSIAVEYSDNETVLPDNLPELDTLLQDPDINKTIRNRIVEKMRMIKQEYVNELRFNKHSIIEKLKSNPDEVLRFKGTNLSTIPGYS